VQARLKTSAPQVLVGGVLLVGLALGATHRLHAADSQAPPTEASVTGDRGDSLVGTLDENFPALRARLRLSSPFQKTTWRHGEESVEGLRPQREVSPEASASTRPASSTRWSSTRAGSRRGA